MTVTAVQPNRWFWPVVAALGAGALWIALGLSSGDRMLETSELHLALRAAAVVATAVAAVLVVERLALTVLFPPSLGQQATGLQRVLTFGLLTFAASFVTLSYLGVDPRTVLTTSALATAAVGLAVQPTLASIISGLNVHLDSGLRIGDRIDHDGAPLTITGMNWRTTTGTRVDGSLVVITNAHLADSPLVIHRAEQGARLMMTIPAPLSLSPAQVSELLVDIMIDLDAIDTNRTFTVTPSDFQTRLGIARYQVTGWFRPGANLITAKGELLSRLWYSYQRRRIRLPTSTLLSAPRDEAGADLDTAPRRAALMAPFLVEGALGEDCEVLMYGPGEPLIAPERTDGRRFLILDGRAVKSPPFGGGGSTTIEFSDAQARKVAAAALASELSTLIGPYGEYAVWLAARAATDSDDLRRRVADEITDETAKAAFLAKSDPRPEAVFAAGDVLHAERDAFGVLTCGETLRAQGEVSLLAVPKGAWAHLPKVRAVKTSS